MSSKKLLPYKSFSINFLVLFLLRGTVFLTPRVRQSLFALIKFLHCNGKILSVYDFTICFIFQKTMVFICLNFVQWNWSTYTHIHTQLGLESFCWCVRQWRGHITVLEKRYQISESFWFYVLPSLLYLVYNLFTYKVGQECCWLKVNY